MLAVYASTFEGNVGREGGAVGVPAGSAAFVDSRFTDNAGVGLGGALFLARSGLAGSIPVPRLDHGLPWWTATRASSGPSGSSAPTS